MDKGFIRKHARYWASEVWGMDQQEAESFAEWYVREYAEEEEHNLPPYSRAVREYEL